MRACAIETHVDMSKEPCFAEISRKNAGPEARQRHFACGSLQGKCRIPIQRATFCASLCSRNHMDVSKEPFFAEIYRKKAAHSFRARHFVRACAVETHMDISQEPFCVEIYRENAGPPGEVNTSIEHRAFYTYRKNPFSVATLFGEKVTSGSGKSHQGRRITMARPVSSMTYT